ncbi:sensor domain-containing diguanylate cyclase [Anaerocolumna xylanovorans]|uniref:PAS domain S-box-containing protein/diguanylate cyclase (GGDEF) domain-containing protein n=1 Tax=Anaerocolumna xylanovorans DSM 12503 TaxID=1121345 RepID=A0A1M7YM29_9FIRM|nr:diguanylate cyclase [Anaerocolumna xylanovorans]SHO53642.1 PAS domain S-box-containing protein/diguanylate cyclase (GGDEF) domain-containing protein [Anaerocolumna xylanovorans DSM 12503]
MKENNTDNILKKGIPRLNNTIGISLGLAVLASILLLINFAVKDNEMLYEATRKSGVVFLFLLFLLSLIISFISSILCNNQVKKATTELAHITKSVHAGFFNFLLGSGYQITYANPKFYEIIGYGQNEIELEYDNCFLRFVYEEDKEKIRSLKKEFSNGTYIQIELRMVTRSGEVINILLNGNFALDKDGEKSLSAVLLDVTSLKDMQDKLTLEEERYRIAAEISNDILFEYKVERDIMIFADKYKEVYGRNPVIENFTAVDTYKKSMVHPEDYQDLKLFARTLCSGKGMIEAEFRIKNINNEFVWCHIRGKTIYDEYKDAVSVIGKVVNIDLHKKELQKLEYKAKRDLLTGVYNKVTTKEIIDDYLRRNNNSKHILMMIDIDDFKHVNDNYGHLAGDNILVFIMDKIKRIFPKEVIGRVGGDEFIVFSQNVENMECIINKANLLREALDTAYAIDEQEVYVSGSIGISLYPEDGTTYTELINCADKALYSVKDEGKGSFKLFT